MKVFGLFIQQMNIYIFTKVHCGTGRHKDFKCHKNVNFCNNFVGLMIADNLKSKI